MSHQQSFWPGLLLLAAATVSANEAPNVPSAADAREITAPNIPLHLLESLAEPTALAPGAEANAKQTLTSSPPAVPAYDGCDAVDCFPPEEPELDTDTPASKQPAAPPVRIGPPAQRAIVESHNWAENPKAMPVRDLNGRVVFQFSDSAPTVVCRPMNICDIELEPGEIVQGAPHIGDGVRWKVSPAVSGSDEHRVTHLIIKPTEVGLDTNLIIPTDRRTYHLRLVSNAQHYVSSVAFEYPDNHQQLWQAVTRIAPRGDSGNSNAAGSEMPTVAVNRLNFNYKIKVVKGKPTFKPLRAMDDGYHTYIAMNEDLPQREAPALVGISPDGAEQMINYRLKGNLYMVDGTIFKLALISGVGRDQQRIEVTRDACRRRGWLGICWDAKE